MVDSVSKSVRSKIMSKIRGKNTRPEIVFRKSLFAHGIRYRRSYPFKGIRCKPDAILVSKRVCVFVDGCFWHKCPRCFRKPKSNLSYWGPKIRANVARDKRQNHWFKKNKWKVIRIWEHKVKNPKKLEKIISRIISL